MKPPLRLRFAAAALGLTLVLPVALFSAAFAAEGIEEVEMSGHFLVQPEKVVHPGSSWVKA